MGKSRILAEVNIDDFGAAGDSSTDDLAALTAAQNVLGATGGVIRLSANKGYYFSRVVLNDNVTLDGGLTMPPQAVGASFSMNYNAMGRIVLDSAIVSTMVTSVDAPISQDYLILVANQTTQVGGPLNNALLPVGTVLTGTNGATNRINLSQQLTQIVPAGTTITHSTAGIALGNGSSVKRCLIIKKGITTPPADATSAQTEINTWATGGNAVSMLNVDGEVDHCLIIGFQTGISIYHTVRHRVNRVYIDCWNGILVGSTGDVPYFADIHCWPFYVGNLAIASGATSTSQLLNYRPGIGIGLLGPSQDIKLQHCFVYGYQQDFLLQNTIDVALYFCYADNILALTQPDPGNGNLPYITTYGFNVSGGCRSLLLIGCQQDSNSHGYYQNADSTTNVTTLIGCSSVQAVAEHVNVAQGAMDLNRFKAIAGSYAFATPILASANCGRLVIDEPTINGFDSSIALFNINSTALANTTKRGGLISGGTGDTLGEKWPALSTTVPTAGSGKLYKTGGGAVMQA